MYMNDITGLFTNNGFQGIVVLIDDVLNIIKVNTNFETLLGYQQDVVNQPFTNFILPDEKSSFFDLLYNQEEHLPKVIRLYHSSGAYRYFSITVYSFKDSKILFGKPIDRDFKINKYYKGEPDGEIKISTSSIEAKNIFNLLEVDNPLLTHILNVIPFDVWIKDLHGRYVFVNNSFQKSTGLNLENILRKEDYEIFDKAIAKRFVDSDYIAIESKKPLRYVFELEGEKFPTFTDVMKLPLFNDDGDYIGLFSFAVDVTETKQLQNQFSTQLLNIDHALSYYDGIIFETDYIGNTYFIYGSLIQHLPKKNLKDINMYEIFELLGVEVRSIKDVNRVIVHQEQKRLYLNKGIVMDIEVKPFIAANGDTHLLGFGKVVKDE